MRQKLRKIEQRLKEKHKYELCYSEEFVRKISQNFIGHKRGIRAIETYLSQNIIPMLTETALSRKSQLDQPKKIIIG
jgi:ATP-dependent Clp protease ATP-binding subunit ClpA